MGVSPRGRPGDDDPSRSPRTGGVLATAGEVEVLLLLAEVPNEAEGRVPVVRSPAPLPGREEEEVGSPTVFSLPLLSLPALPTLRGSFLTDRSKGSLRAEAGRAVAPTEREEGKDEENEVKGVVLAASTRGREEGTQHGGRGGSGGRGE